MTHLHHARTHCTAAVPQVILADLEQDLRRMMLPNTALSLKVRQGPPAVRHGCCNTVRHRAGNDGVRGHH